MSASAEAPARPPEAPLDIAVGFVGERSRDWLGGPVAAVEVSASGGAPGALDALVVDPAPAGVTRAALERLVADARERGARVIGLSAGDKEPLWAGLCDAHTGAAAGDGSARVPGPAPIDPRVLNPIGFRQSDVAGLCAVTRRKGSGKPLGDALSILVHASEREPLLVYAPYGTSLRDAPGVGVKSIPAEGDEILLTALQDYLGVIDHPDFHQGPLERAGWIVRLCACGVPVAAEGLDHELAELLGEELCGAIEGRGWRDLLDLDLRERISVAQRRAALRNHSLDARWRQLAQAVGLSPAPRPKVSVILSTRRQEWLEHGIEQVSRQNYEPRELVVCLHGDGFTDDVEAQVRSLWPEPLRIVRVDRDLTLGDALNAGVEAASGELVTKMDDDDYYSADHLWDLVLAIQYSGADLVGKAAEFVYLQEVHLTVRQQTRDIDSRLAGGGMMARREPLRAIGGWPSMSRNEDRALVARFEEADRRVHRTYPHGYILNRHGRDHTWRPYVDYFLLRSGQQWRGLEFDQTGIR